MRSHFWVRVLTGQRDCPPPAIHALDLSDDDEIRDILTVWVIDTKKTLNVVILHVIPL